MGVRDTREMSLLCAAFVQAYHACDASLLAPFLADEAVFCGLVCDHTGAEAVSKALFSSGVRRACKPEARLALEQSPEEQAQPQVFDMLITSVDELWPEHLYLDRVTVHHGKVTRLLRRTLASVAGGGLSNFDGRDRYKLAGRALSDSEAKERVAYTWDAERFLCRGFGHMMQDLLPPGTQIPADVYADNA